VARKEGAAKGEGREDGRGEKGKAGEEEDEVEGRREGREGAGGEGRKERRRSVSSRSSDSSSSASPAPRSDRSECVCIVCVHVCMCVIVQMHVRMHACIHKGFANSQDHCSSYGCTYTVTATRFVVAPPHWYTTLLHHLSSHWLDIQGFASHLMFLLGSDVSVRLLLFFRYFC